MMAGGEQGPRYHAGLATRSARARASSKPRCTASSPVRATDEHQPTRKRVEEPFGGVGLIQ